MTLLKFGEYKILESTDMESTEDKIKELEEILLSDPDNEEIKSELDFLYTQLSDERTEPEVQDTLIEDIPIDGGEIKKEPIQEEPVEEVSPVVASEPKPMSKEEREEMYKRLTYNTGEKGQRQVHKTFRDYLISKGMPTDLDV